MAVYTYFGNLTDLGLGPLTRYSPRLTVRPKEETWGPHGPVSEVRKVISVATNGDFSFTALASGDLNPATDYILELCRFEETFDGSTVPAGLDVWEFTAVVGGGNVAQMQGASMYSIWLGGAGVPWPDGTPPGLYIDLESPNPWGVKY